MYLGISLPCDVCVYFCLCAFVLCVCVCVCVVCVCMRGNFTFLLDMCIFYPCDSYICVSVNLCVFVLPEPGISLYSVVCGCLCVFVLCNTCDPGIWEYLIFLPRDVFRCPLVICVICVVITVFLNVYVCACV